MVPQFKKVSMLQCSSYHKHWQDCTNPWNSISRVPGVPRSLYEGPWFRHAIYRDVLSWHRHRDGSGYLQSAFLERVSLVRIPSTYLDLSIPVITNENQPREKGSCHQRHAWSWGNTAGFSFPSVESNFDLLGLRLLTPN